MSWEVAMLLLPGLVIGLTLHEFAHAWSASLLGDDFARRQGRVSLNPLRHLSPLGTLALFLLGFGWGRPVPVNLYNFERPKRDYLVTSLAGPAANVIVATVCLLLMLLTRRTYAFGRTAGAFIEMAHLFLGLIALINVILATVNLLPIPPLDGSKIWPCLIPKLKPSFRPRTTKFFIIILLVLLWTGSLGALIGSVIDQITRVMPTSDARRYERAVERGSEDFDEGRFEDAEKRATEAVSINPFGHKALHQRAAARRELGRPEEALEDADRAIRLSSRIGDYYALRAKILADLHRGEEAERDVARARELGSEALPAAPEAGTTAPASRPGAGVD